MVGAERVELTLSVCKADVLSRCTKPPRKFNYTLAENKCQGAIKLFSSQALYVNGIAS